ncbi:peptidylprolyl isomerase [Shimia haliotis]|uniref:Parvulin-like PPIase n=1 Tax=Shimia haliotis TaxID=1280847 RepID=A0A1I4AUE3_9RHOB|nr:peptidylprolyl isomerase [Shimia haliotis]SFK59491.1 periplasmic chaperone for outer membrane proteins SurA [Shimia haliotis]
MTTGLLKRFALSAFLAASTIGLHGGPVLAQGAFSPAVTVNDQVVTNYEIDQRARLLTVMNTPGDTFEEAKKQLIDDRLKVQAARIVGISVPEEGVQAGLAEFAQRVNMDPESLIKALAGEGIDEETMRAFIISGITWRGFVQARFGGNVEITEEEIDRAIASNSGSGGLNVLLSEIVIPITPQTQAQVLGLVEQLSEIRSFDEFEQAARTYSQSPTKDDGGRIQWMSVTNLPPQLRPLIAALSPGEVTAPVQLPNAVALFQMRRVEEATAPAPRYSAIDYAIHYLPGGRSAETLAKAQELADRIDRCDDLYGINKGQPPELLVRNSEAPGEIPRDIALELAKLDENEISTALTTSDGQNLLMLMLCGRTAELGEELSRDEVANILRNQRLENYAESHLSQLRAQARIIEQ